MCLTIPAKVVEVLEDGTAFVEQPGTKRKIINMIKAKPGEFVLLQQGMAVDKISEKEANETWALWSEAAQKH